MYTWHRVFITPFKIRVSSLPTSPCLLSLRLPSNSLSLRQPRLRCLSDSSSLSYTHAASTLRMTLEFRYPQPAGDNPAVRTHGVLYRTPVQCIQFCYVTSAISQPKYSDTWFNANEISFMVSMLRGGTHRQQSKIIKESLSTPLPTLRNPHLSLSSHLSASCTPSRSNYIPSSRTETLLMQLETKKVFDYLVQSFFCQIIKEFSYCHYWSVNKTNQIDVLDTPLFLKPPGVF